MTPTITDKFDLMIRISNILATREQIKRCD
jgi:hypothetical protein